MTANDDVGQPVSLGRERWMVGMGRQKKKGNLGAKNVVGLECIKKKYNFHIKSWFSNFIKLGSKKYIFTK